MPKLWIQKMKQIAKDTRNNLLNLFVHELRTRNVASQRCALYITEAKGQDFPRKVVRS